MILWLTSKSGHSPTTKAMLLNSLKPHGIKSTDIVFYSLHYKVPTLGDYQKKKLPTTSELNAARKTLTEQINALKPNLIVVQDEPTLRTITGNPYTLATVRGSVYHFNGVPCLILDKIANIYTTNAGKFIFQLDLGRLVRYATGKQKPLSNFNFFLCRTVQDVLDHVSAAKRSYACAVDIETISGFISSVAYTYISRENRLVTFCVPFFDPWVEGAAYWHDIAHERHVRLALADLNSSSTIKILQNGMYDSAYFIVEGMPLCNYYADTRHLMHSIWVEAPNALHELASYFVDGYVYWKDDAKGVQEDGIGKSHADIEKYWRYNGLDTYYTFLVGVELFDRIRYFDWAKNNYNTEFSLSIGPCLAASLRGLTIDSNRHTQIMARKLKEANEGDLDIQALTGERDFNIRSPNDVAWFVYDVLGAKQTRLQRKGGKYGPRSTDEKVLKLIKERSNVVIANFIDRLLKAKKPATVLSKFGNLTKLCYKNGQFLSWLNPAGTTTGRFNSTGSQFWTGTNGQNWEPELREMVVAPPGYFLLDIDFAGSDDRFIAYESEDLDKIELVEGPLDGHCFHASIFFSRNYDDIYQGWKQNSPWVVDSTVGVRQITKHSVHGRNFRMSAGTLYNQLGRDATVATAEAMGYENAMRMTDKELIGVCQILCDKYDHPTRGMYKRIRAWQDEITELAITNKNLVTCAFGMTRHFFGDLRNDHKKQRDLSAFYGQGGTAGNANRVLRRIFYSGIDNGSDCLFIMQGHDSLLFAIRNTHMHLVKDIKDIMEEYTVIHGRSMRVPAQPDVGLTWSKKMLSWTPATKFADIVDFEEKTFGAKFPKNSDMTLEILNSLHFNDDFMSSFEKQLAEFEPQDGEDDPLDDELELVDTNDEEGVA